MTLTTQLRIGIAPCGCLHELRNRRRVIEVWRCPLHRGRYIRIESVWPWRRCESCRRRRGRYRATFSDRASWLLCLECEPGRPR